MPRTLYISHWHACIMRLACNKAYSVHAYTFNVCFALYLYNHACWPYPCGSMSWMNFELWNSLGPRSLLSGSRLKRKKNTHWAFLLFHCHLRFLRIALKSCETLCSICCDFLRIVLKSCETLCSTCSFFLRIALKSCENNNKLAVLTTRWLPQL